MQLYRYVVATCPVLCHFLLTGDCRDLQGLLIFLLCLWDAHDCRVASVRRLFEPGLEGAYWMQDHMKKLPY